MVCSIREAHTGGNCLCPSRMCHAERAGSGEASGSLAPLGACGIVTFGNALRDPILHFLL